MTPRPSSELRTHAPMGRTRRPCSPAPALPYRPRCTERTDAMPAPPRAVCA
jgi:hypothetical protein